MVLNKKKLRILVAMSGGVDSSVAAALLVDQGFDVIGATMQVWDYSKNKAKQDSDCDVNGTCCSSDDVDDARWVADQLRIPFYVLNCEDQFQAEVIDPFLESYLCGKTPIPCINCNTFLKFSHLIQKMKELDCDYLATGHYAKIVTGDNNEQLIQTSEDGHKDQTYFLFTLNKEVISKIIFPVGNMNKSEVRRIAEEKKLIVAKKKDSIGICFIKKNSYKEFFSDHVAPDLLNKGPIVLYPENKVMGEHSGLYGFTYGQRKSLGVNFLEPLFVKSLDMENNKLILCRKDDLYAYNVQVRDCNFFTDVFKGEVYRVKLRYQHKGADCTVEDIKNSLVKLKFNDPQRAITPGQAAVFYKENNLVGGGWIV